MEEQRTIHFTDEDGFHGFAGYVFYLVHIVGNNLLREVARYNKTPRFLRWLRLRRVKAAIRAFDELVLAFYPPAPCAGSPFFAFMEQYKEYLENERTHN